MWDDIHCFVVASETGSLSAAAKRLGVSVATVSRKIESLETSLKLTLLTRLTTGVELTAEGGVIYNSAKNALEKISEVERTAVSLREGVDIEPVVVSSTEPIISDILAEQLPAFWRENPDIQLRLSVATENISVARRDADITIRLARPTQDNVVIKKLPVIRQGFYASKAYLKGRDPNHLNFRQETFLGMDKSFGEIPESLWITEQGLSSRQILESSSVRTLRMAAVLHCGIAMLPDFIARRAGLIKIATPEVPLRSPYMLFHKDFRSVKRIKKVREWIINAFDNTLVKEGKNH
ncbi:LysR family transcriptional regulator [Aestuariicella sp. G3-2]|uniref:LysR family transcriptional regulator n=1 Tax=Pseudomaricurvus albidus TaxID=2842452 RepID=UPI001C0DE045|nr:LysR family transcriptional regulator [Aestuariicella albida]MBU3071305.1 LysR family transcriptional regulator [Aestuariicella albida]